MRRYFIEIAVFISGAVVMMLELVGSRVLAPYVGTSLYVWSSLIGVILGSLSLGYWLGGELADRTQKQNVLALILFSAAILVGLIGFLKSVILLALTMLIPDIRIGAIAATTILFAAPSILLGIVSPYAARLRIRDTKSAGSVVGRLYALSTTGSILGTFAAGFFIIPVLGTNKILFLLSLLLLFASMLVAADRRTLSKIFIASIFVSTGVFAPPRITSDIIMPFVADMDTAYSRVLIFDYPEPKTSRPMRMLSTGLGQFQSSIYTDNPDELAFDYIKFFTLAAVLNPKQKNALLIGGGVYTLPRYIAQNYPNIALDVVEIDPALTSIANRYFYLTANPGFTIHQMDGRMFLDRTNRVYDTVWIDAFSGIIPPFQLTTLQAAKKIYEHLTDNGLAFINIVSPIEGADGKFLRAEYRTYASVFPRVLLFPLADATGTSLQNVVLIASKSQDPLSFDMVTGYLTDFIKNQWTKPIQTDVPILTDDFAPVEYYVRNTL